MKKRLIYLLFVIGFLVANAWVLVHRNEGYRYFPYETYSKLYVDDGMLYLEDLKISGNTAELFFSRPLVPGAYKMYVDSSADFTSLNAVEGKLAFKPVDGIHLYSFYPADSTGRFIQLKFDYNPEENELLFCNIPGPQIEVADAKRWTYNTPKFSQEDLDTAISILKRETRVFQVESDLEKAKEIAKYMMSIPDNANGTPQPLVSKLNPAGQLQLALKKNADLACGNYTAIYYYLAYAAGLKNRAVRLVGGEKDWSYGVHYYNEVYLRESEQWTVADASFNLFYPNDGKGKFFNAVDIKKMTAINGFGDKYIYRSSGDSMANVPYGAVNTDHIFYHRSNADMCFLHSDAEMGKSALNLFLEFYTLDRDFSYYSDVKNNNWIKIGFKYLVLAGFVISFFFYLAFEAANFNGRKQAAKSNFSPSPVSRNAG